MDDSPLAFGSPQADRLDYIRRILQAIEDGAASARAVADACGLAIRYVNYGTQAAQLLALTAAAAPSTLTARGRALLGTRPYSAAERQAITDAILASAATSHWRELMLGQTAPTTSLLAAAIEEHERLSPETAARRAQTLVAWRRYLLGADHQGQMLLSFVEDALPRRSAPVAPASKGRRRSARLTAAGDAPTRGVLPDSLEPPAQPGSPTPMDGGASPVDPHVPVGASEMTPQALAYLRTQIAAGRAILFTGSGFSAAARDLSGKPLPSGPALAREISSLCFPNDDSEQPALQDVFEYAVARKANALRGLLLQRLRIDSSSLPESYRSWFSFPWRAIYTLNADDLEEAVARRWALPRRPRSVSGRAVNLAAAEPNELPVVHLNGCVSEDLTSVTFSTSQYAARLASRDPYYAQLAGELQSYCFVFVGTPLDETLFWQHLHFRRVESSRAAEELRAKCFLVSPTLSRAKAAMLAEYNVVWVAATAESFANDVLGKLTAEAHEGVRRLAYLAGRARDDEANISDVATLAARPPKGQSLYLLGDEPTWSDIREERAVARSEDATFSAQVVRLAATARDPRRSAPITIVRGTAGAGKSTLMMRTAMALSSRGNSVAWVDRGTEISPGTLVRAFGAAHAPAHVFVDDADRYGRELFGVLRDITQQSCLRMVVVSVHSASVRLPEELREAGIECHVHDIGPLTDADIDGILSALRRDHKLGALRGQDHAAQRRAFRDRADRQILVAMLEATSGKRFEEKVIEEWMARSSDEKYVYALVCLAAVCRFEMHKDEVLSAMSERAAESHKALVHLVRSNVLRETEFGQIRARHRTIAQTLISELTSRGTALGHVYRDLAVGMAMRAPKNARRSTRIMRIVKRLISHDQLMRMLELEDARRVYESLQDVLDWDYHYWLQRGSLEVEFGDVRQAENALDQAYAMNPDDALVQTEHAYMRLKKASSNPAAPGAVELAAEAIASLVNLVESRGSRDPYPYTVLGTQGLRWSQRRSWPSRERHSFLKKLFESVKTGAERHPREASLVEVRDRIHVEMLQAGLRC